MGTHTLEICPSCAGGESTCVDLDADHELRRCTTCSLVYAANYADPDDIYVDGYLSGQTVYGLDIFDPLFQEFLDFAASKRMDVIEPLVGSTGSMLDVGCGAGEVLHVAQRRGWQVAGAEPVEESAEIARQRGLDVRTAMLADADLPSGTGTWSARSTCSSTSPTAWPSSNRWRAGRSRAASWSSRCPTGAAWSASDGRRTGRCCARSSTSPTTTPPPSAPRSSGPGSNRCSCDPWDSCGRSRPSNSSSPISPTSGGGACLRPITRSRERHGRRGRFPGAVVHRALLATQARYDRRRRGQVVLGAARVPA
ncbi:MAG: hypothetical protein U5R31_14405 [Acidimicrobiia bacterium]|nr:hypothetical protein [Acidimicrobiia bacterium]